MLPLLIMRGKPIRSAQLTCLCSFTTTIKVLNEYRLSIEFNPIRRSGRVLKEDYCSKLDNNAIADAAIGCNLDSDQGDHTLDTSQSSNNYHIESSHLDRKKDNVSSSDQTSNNHADNFVDTLLIKKVNAITSPIDKLHNLLKTGSTAKKAAWDQYQRVLKDSTMKLGYLDHVRLLTLLCINAYPSDVEKMDEIYQNMKTTKLNISPKIAEMITIKAAQNNLIKLSLKYREELKWFNVRASNDVHAGIINLYRRRGNLDKAFEYIRKLERKGVNIHLFKRILADMHFRVGDKDKSIRVFKEYVSNEPSIELITNAYGWFACNYINEGDYTKAETLIDEFSQKHNAIPSPLLFNCLARIAIARAKLSEAELYILREMELTRRCSFHTVTVSLIHSYLGQNNIDKAMSTLTRYRAQHERHRNSGGLQYSPYIAMIQYFAENGEMQSMMNVFQLIHAGKFTSNHIIRVMIDGYIIMNDMSGAMNFLKLANQMGYKPRGPEGTTLDQLEQRITALKEHAADRAKIATTMKPGLLPAFWVPNPYSTPLKRPVTSE